MVTPKNLTQDGIDEIWGAVWRQERPAMRRELFSNRLFVEGYPIFKKYVPNNAHQLLDVGSGSGRYGVRFASDFPESKVYLTDITDDSLAVIRHSVDVVGVTNIIVQKEDMFSFSFAGDSFDVVFCDVVIQHVAHPEEAIREMLRVLRPGGRLIVSAVNRWNFHSLMKQILKLFGRPYRYGYERSYSSYELAALVRECGGQVIARDGFYVAYGIFRLRHVHSVFAIVGKILNRLITYVDRFTGRWFSRHFGFEIFCVASKEWELTMT